MCSSGSGVVDSTNDQEKLLTNETRVSEEREKRCVMQCGKRRARRRLPRREGGESGVSGVSNSLKSVMYEIEKTEAGMMVE